VGHDLESHTSEIRATRCTIGKTSIVLVDTPGFDDTKKTDLEILESIADWLRETYEFFFIDFRLFYMLNVAKIPRGSAAVRPTLLPSHNR